MKKKIIIELVILICFLSCKTNIDTINIPHTNTLQSIEKFDLTFDTYHSLKKERGIEEIRGYYSNNYYEIKKYKKKFYSEVKIFYTDGTIRQRGNCYHYNNSFFRVGLWEFYNTDSKLIKTIDYDYEQKINYKIAFEIAKEQNFYPKNSNICYQSGYWYIYKVKGRKKDKGIKINVTNGDFKIMRHSQFSNSIEYNDIENLLENIESDFENFESDLKKNIKSSDSSFYIILGKTKEKSILEFLRKADDEFKIYADGLRIKTTKTFFGKKTVTFGTGYSISRLAFKKYGISIKLSKGWDKERPDLGRTVIDIEIFDNKNIDSKESIQNHRYYDADFITVDKKSILGTFGNSYINYATEKTECFEYEKICFVFEKDKDVLLGVIIK